MGQPNVKFRGQSTKAEILEMIQDVDDKAFEEML
jgi:hypothetical protein